jgi:DNA-binding transcriptional MerR regulator
MTSADVCARAHITYRQLDHWTRRGYISPSNGQTGTGVGRQWTRAEADHIRRMAALIQFGVEQKTAAAIARRLATHDDKVGFRKGSLVASFRWES